jgi:hypothetical protein
MRLACALVLIVAGAGACSNPERKETSLMNETHNAPDDDRLVARVRAAVEARVPADGLAAFVGERPLFDTTAGSSLLAAQRTDFAPDPDHPGERIERSKARAIVYWRRPVPGHDPHVVGIQVGDANAARVFFAIILPPG